MKDEARTLRRTTATRDTPRQSVQLGYREDVVSLRVDNDKPHWPTAVHRVSRSWGQGDPPGEFTLDRKSIWHRLGRWIQHHTRHFFRASVRNVIFLPSGRIAMPTGVHHFHLGNLANWLRYHRQHAAERSPAMYRRCRLGDPPGRGILADFD